MISTTKTLKMVFATDEEKDFTLSLKDCKPDISGDDVKGGMDELLDAQPFDVTLTSKKGAKVIDRTVEETVLF